MATNALRYLEEVVRTSIKTDIVDVAAFHAKRQKCNSGHFSTPRQVFCYVDHLGYLAFGSTSTDRAIKFIKAYFPEIYKQYSELIYVMWRHGTVHELRPTSYFASLNGAGDKEVRWFSSNHNRKKERQQHLLVFRIQNIPNAVYLVVNCCVLAKDLSYAVEKYIDHLRSNPKEQLICAQRIDSLNKVRDYKSTGKAINESVKSQIRLAWHNSDGLIDRRNNVIEPHHGEHGRA